MTIADGSPAQQQPRPPPDAPPESRLTLSPSEFERWLGRATGAGGATTEPAAAAPRLVSPPPPPVLAAPPPPPVLPLPAAPATPPAAPSLGAPPEPPSTVILPPESDATSPLATAVPEAAAAAPEPVRIVYAAGRTDVPQAAHPELDALAAWLRDKPDVRIELLGYASESSTTGSRARRLALLRVIAVRDYLVGQGVLSTRMDVRALGDRSAEGPRDRVEIRLPPS